MSSLFYRPTLNCLKCAVVCSEKFTRNELQVLSGQIVPYRVKLVIITNSWVGLIKWSSLKKCVGFVSSRYSFDDGLHFYTLVYNYKTFNRGVAKDREFPIPISLGDWRIGIGSYSKFMTKTQWHCVLNWKNSWGRIQEIESPKKSLSSQEVLVANLPGGINY